MIIGKSKCHFADSFYDYPLHPITQQPYRYEALRCSFCGERCEEVPRSLTLGADVELTIRRWKDGDCSLDDMFERINEELRRSWQVAADEAAKSLQRGQSPKIDHNFNTGKTKRVGQPEVGDD